jgi:hypothetical protein
LGFVSRAKRGFVILGNANATLRVDTDFDVARFGGTKSIVISNVSVIGGKNPFLGIAYMVVGSLCWVFGILFLIRHMIKPRKLGDHTYLSWNQSAPQGGGTPVLGQPPKTRPAEPIPMQTMS